jgi:protein-disulfide isomerase
MRRTYLLLGFICLSGLALLLVAKTISKQAEKAAVAPRIVSGPVHFSFLTIKDRPFTDDSLPPDKPVGFILFSPSCDDCRDQVQDIYAHRQLYHDITLLLVTNEDAASTRHFAITEKLDSLPFVKVLLDTSNSLFRYFGVFTTPTIFVYDGHRRLVKKYTGEVKSENIIKCALENEE